jgi:hypothetical protein
MDLNGFRWMMDDDGRFIPTYRGYNAHNPNCTLK